MSMIWAFRIVGDATFEKQREVVSDSDLCCRICESVPLTTRMSNG